MMKKRSYLYAIIAISIARILEYGAMPRRNVVGRSGTKCTATDGVRHGLLECYKIVSTPTKKNDNTQRMSYAM
jgi:hypothetical protein